MAAKLAFDLKGEIISADSRQVYRNMDIGTGKDLKDYVVDGRTVPYHMIDIINPEHEFNLFEYQKRFYEVFRELREKKKMPVLVGGTGLYLESVLCGYDMPEAPPDQELRVELKQKSAGELQKMLLALKPDLHNKTDLENSERLIRAIEIEKARINMKQHSEKPDLDAVVFGLRWERSVLRHRITLRLQERLDQGMIEEVMRLYHAGLNWNKLESFGLEYRFVSHYLRGKITFDEMKSKLNTAIHQFAKRQETWFRRMEKRGVEINWLPNDDYILLKESVMKYLQ